MTASLMTGHTQIDAEHEHILVLMNQFDSCLKADDNAGCSGKIDQLTEALVSHLENEEEILKGHGYPKLEDHKEQHRKASKDYFALIKKSERDGYCEGFSQSLIAILADDLIMADMEFKDYLAKMTRKS